MLDFLRVTIWNDCNAWQMEVSIIADKSRADYMKARRESKKTFSVSVDKEKMIRFEKKISEQKQTKAEWLNEKIDEELNQ